MICAHSAAPTQSPQRSRAGWCQNRQTRVSKQAALLREECGCPKERARRCSEAVRATTGNHVFCRLCRAEAAQGAAAARRRALRRHARGPPRAPVHERAPREDPGRVSGAAAAAVAARRRRGDRRGPRAPRDAQGAGRASHGTRPTHRGRSGWPAAPLPRELGGRPRVPWAERKSCPSFLILLRTSRGSQSACQRRKNEQRRCSYGRDDAVAVRRYLAALLETAHPMRLGLATRFGPPALARATAEAVAVATASRVRAETPRGRRRTGRFRRARPTTRAGSAARDGGGDARRRRRAQVRMHDNGFFGNLLQLLDVLATVPEDCAILVDWRPDGGEGHFTYGADLAAGARPARDGAAPRARAPSRAAAAPWNAAANMRGRGVSKPRRRERLRRALRAALRCAGALRVRRRRRGAGRGRRPRGHTRTDRRGRAGRRPEQSAAEPRPRGVLPGFIFRPAVFRRTPRFVSRGVGTARGHGSEGPRPRPPF